MGQSKFKTFLRSSKKKRKKSFLRGPKNGKRQHTPPHQLPLENNFCWKKNLWECFYELGFSVWNLLLFVFFWFPVL
jgi:hypothetical protein